MVQKDFPEGKKTHTGFKPGIRWVADKQGVRNFFIIFYLVGITGMTIPVFFPWFVRLIPFALLLSFGFTAYFHNYRNNQGFWPAITLIFVLGMAVEIFGTHTGIVFGEYSYGDSLGAGIFSVPLLIGINWTFLVYASSSLFEGVRMHAGLKVLLASIILVLYDLVMEQSAPLLDMWYWQDNAVPLQNYLAWFGIAIIFHSLLKIFRVNTTNPVAATILVCQFIFFLAVFALNY